MIAHPTHDPDGELAKLSFEQLREHEEYLYDLERDGHETWFERDRILWELNFRDWK